MNSDVQVPPPAMPLTTTPGSAATVVLLRDGELGVEVLLAERPHDRGSFAGAWVFPGGAVDPDDVAGAPGGPGDEDAVRRAAVRETREEVGLALDPGELVPFSRWTPPEGAPKPLVTTFFALRVPDGELRPAPDEVVALEWIRPCDALARHARGQMILWPPTWVTLHGLARAESVDTALAELRAGTVRPYRSRFIDGRRTIVWEEDAAYLDAAAEGVPVGPPDGGGAGRHRLLMDGLPWRYQVSP
ncbi:NUDIX domain-containing protein [Agromyces sp. MMS24-K17]|uniref:NUDIX hydrolase n=1 Tax=Agromyces sp. MMS24-K17 TaxID=3372850 RepID=UPI003753F06F